MSDKVQVSIIPQCDFCGDGTPAKYDARIPGMGWANVCQDHFESHYCKVGTGNGQELTTEPIVSNRSEAGRKTLADMVDLLGGDEDEILMLADDMGLSDLFD